MKYKRKKKSGFYKGQYIEENSVYGFKKFPTVLFYCPKEGVELYFTRMSKAKRYLDTLRPIDMIKPIGNDIPF